MAHIILARPRTCVSMASLDFNRIIPVVEVPAVVGSVFTMAATGIIGGSIADSPIKRWAVFLRISNTKMVIYDIINQNIYSVNLLCFTRGITYEKDFNHLNKCMLDDFLFLFYYLRGKLS